MRTLLAVLVPCCVLIASHASGEKVFPYKAYVTAGDVYVRSGPGQTYYPTDKLKLGQEVEVYRHDPGGWYAIRPPEGSFTWVSSRFLEPGVDQLAVVTDDRVAARVGSRFSDIRDVIQVRLNKAEVVELLPDEQSVAQAEQTSWRRITPPSGEFRWVFGKYVDPDYPHDGVRKTSADKSVVIVPDSAIEQTAGTAKPTMVSPVVAKPKQMEPAVVDKPLVDKPTGASPTPRSVSPEEYRAEFDQMDVELSIMVAEEPTVWTFSEMRRRVDELSTQAQTAVEQGLARVMLNKIARFEELRQRYDEINSVRSQTEHSNRRLADSSRSQRTVKRQPDKADRYDGVGELTRVVSAKLGAPRYALVDGNGGVSCYVSPAPGVSLRHYVGRRVGVTGTRGYMPEQRAHHIMAQHVDSLHGPRLR